MCRRALNRFFLADFRQVFGYSSDEVPEHFHEIVHVALKLLERVNGQSGVAFLGKLFEAKGGVKRSAAGKVGNGALLSRENLTAPF
jgi:hypothetical protein